jgi:hypothetical protein
LSIQNVDEGERLDHFILQEARLEIGVMRTTSEESDRAVAVETEEPITIGKPFTLRLPIHVLACTPLTIATIDVIKSKKVNVILATTRASTAISLHKFLLDPLSRA